MKKEKIYFAAGLIVVLSVNLYLRSFPINFPQLKTQAKEIVRQMVQQQAMMEVHKRFPQFYYSAKDAIVQSEIKQYYKFNKKNIDKQADDFYANMKGRYQDDSGQTYLMELDCWHWARYVENVLKYGHPGDEVIGGRQWDMFMLAPLGFFPKWQQFLFYGSAFLYKVFSLVKPVPLFTFCFYLPLFFTVVFISALYLFSFRYGGHIAGLVSCFMVGLAPVFLPRSCAGWFDTDILNLLFPLLILWAYLKSVEGKSAREKLSWISVSSFLTGLFAWTWTYWWYIFLVIVIYELASCGYLFLAYLRPWGIVNKLLRINSDKDIQQELLRDKLRPLVLQLRYLLIFTALSMVGILIIAGSDPLSELYDQLQKAIFLNRPLSASVWPNVYSTVGELRKMGLNEIGRTVGDTWLVVFSMLCMAIISVRVFLDKSCSDFKRSSIIIFCVWFLAMFFATSRGVRFSVFILVPLSVCAGWLINDICLYFRKRGNAWGTVLAVSFALAICFFSAKKGYATAKGIYPLMDDTWYKVLTMVKEKTPQETIINSWWDFGDWFKVVARRRVIFDGQSQHTPQVYWMAKALLSDNEEFSAAILRMLNNSGNKPFEIMNEHIKNELQAVLLLEYVLSLPQDKAGDVLKKFLPENAALNVSKMLFSRPASAVFAVDHTMPLKMPAISYLGNWDFSKVYIAKNLNKLEKNEIVEYLKGVKGDLQPIETFYQEAFLITEDKLDEWLSGRRQFYSMLVNGTIRDEKVYFDNGFIYGLKDDSLQGAPGQVLRSVFVFKNDNFIEMVNPQPNVNFSALVYEYKGAYKLILMDRDLVPSLFVRLYFLDGRGLRYFAPLIESEEGNNYIRFFAINW